MPARILRLTGVWDAMNIHADVDAAVMAVCGPAAVSQ
jgi:hypothetical protein